MVDAARAMPDTTFVIALARADRAHYRSGVLSRRFDQLYSRLASAYCEYSSVPRTPERVRDLARARARLDDVRREITAERAVVDRFNELVHTYRTIDVAEADIVRPGTG